MIGQNVLIENSGIGEGVDIWHNSIIREGAEIGENTSIGSNVYVGEGVKIGGGCKIQNNVQIFKGVTVGDNVFIGPCVVFTNDKYPTSSDDWILTKTEVSDYASIGANSTILCGVSIGKGCMIGAGSVVTKSVVPYDIVVGNPAKSIKRGSL